MKRNKVLSLYDFTGEAVRPWAEAGYACHCYDNQHPAVDAGQERVEWFPSGGSIRYHYADLHQWSAMGRMITDFEGQVAFLFAFPVCTDLAVSGARHFAAKERARPGFQLVAAAYAEWCAILGEQLGCPYLIENPVSRLATIWRKPNHRFDPCDFGGYLPEDDQHPRWPEVIPARDAYRKRTCLWTGGGFVMPPVVPVKPVEAVYKRADGTLTWGSPMFGKLGGKSARTKNIRSATPRGFARAVFLHNHNTDTQED